MMIERRVWLLVAMVCGIFGSGSRAGGPFPDAVLEKAVREALKLDEKAELTDEKLLDLYFLEYAGKADKPETQIGDLSGLEKCKNLALIQLSRHKISNLAPLKDLVNVQSLDLSYNQIASAEPVQGLVAMQALYLSDNKITDIAPIRALTKLASLYLAKNQIKDISVLESVTRISTMDLSENPIESVAALGKQTELGILMIEKCQVKDLAPLVEAAKADAAGMKRWAPYLRLYLKENPLSDEAKGEQLAALKTIGVRIDGA